MEVLSMERLPAPESGDRGEPRRLRILVVDDNVDYADSTALLLGLYGHSAQTATTGPAAVTALTSEHFDVVLLDIGLPGMTGNDLAKWIQTQAWERPPILIAVTGHGDAATRHLSAESGIAHYLLKPVDPEYLKQLLDRLTQ
jgi:CheY-like chemotaxis protein